MRGWNGPPHSILVFPECQQRQSVPVRPGPTRRNSREYLYFYMTNVVRPAKLNPHSASAGFGGLAGINQGWCKALVGVLSSLPFDGRPGRGVFDSYRVSLACACLPVHPFPCQTSIAAGPPPAREACPQQRSMAAAQITARHHFAVTWLFTLSLCLQRVLTVCNGLELAIMKNARGKRRGSKAGMTRSVHVRQRNPRHPNAALPSPPLPRPCVSRSRIWAGLTGA
jgi:hypothetical protein